MLGFAIGDLRVRKKHKEGETIGIACSSTHPAQIDLIRSMFSQYGRVWIGKPTSRGVVSCEAFVDLSFSFLLKEVREIGWVFESESTFYAFLAGFTDAEGSIFTTSQGKTIMSWGQYDQELLLRIRNTLLSFGYRIGSVNGDNLAGYTGKDGYSRSQDYYRLSCAARPSLLRLLVALKPYLRHDEKVERAVEAIDILSTILDSK